MLNIKPRGARGDCARRRFRGLTLMETALTTVIVGLAITALVKLVLATTQQDAVSQRMTAASLLAENVREMMAGLPFTDPAAGTTGFGANSGETFATYNDTDDFDGFDSTNRPDLSGGAPVGVVDAARRVIVDPSTNQVPDEWKNFRQQIVVEPVDPTNFSTVLPKTVTNRAVVRVTVTVSYKFAGTWQTAAQLRWIKARQ